MPGPFPGLGSLPYLGLIPPTPEGPGCDRLWPSLRGGRGAGSEVVCGVVMVCVFVCVCETELMSRVAFPKRWVGLNV